MELGILAAVESERLSTLRDLRILDTEPEANFDAVCRIARDMFAVPIALISFVEEDRQWFKAKCGTDIDGTRRDIAFCKYTILSDDVFVVEDTFQDERFAINPMVQGEQGIRFYAGAPLTLRPGVHVGALCIKDTKPRMFPPEQVRQLRDLAEIVVSHLRLHEARLNREAEIAERFRVEQSLRAAQADQAMAERTARFGHWRIDTLERTIGWSEGIARIFGRNDALLVLTLERHLSFYHPEDRERVASYLNGALSGRSRLEGGGYKHTSRIVRPNGEVRHVSVHGITEYGDQGRVVALYGVCLDITELSHSAQQQRETSELLRMTLENMDQGILMLGPDDHVRIHNRRARELLGLREDILHDGASFEAICRDHLAIEDAEHSLAWMRQRLREGGLERKPLTHESLHPNGRTLEVRAVPLPDGGEVRTFTDISQRKDAERAVQKSEARYRVLADHATDMVVRRSVTNVRTYVSPASSELLGYFPEEMLTLSFAETIHPEDAEQTERLMSDLRAGRRDQGRIIHRKRHKEGHWVWIEARCRLVRDETGTPVEVITAARDVSERKSAEDALRESERRYRALADALPQIVWIARAADGEASYVNRQFNTHFGAIGTSGAARLARCDAGDDQRIQSAREAVEEGRSFELETRLLRHDGAFRWHKLMMIPVRRGCEIIEWIGTALDIHEIVQARANLEQTTNLLRLAQDAAGAGVWEWDIKAGLIRQSIDSARMHGLVVEEEADSDARIETPAQRFEAYIHPDDFSQVCAEAQRAIDQKATFCAEYRVTRSGKEDEGFGWVQSFGRVIFEAESGNCLKIVGLNLDVTERKQAEAALRLSEESLALALDGGTDGLWDWNVVTGDLDISGRFFQVLGYEIGEIEADIGCWSKLVHPDDAESALHLMREYLRGHSSVYECEYRLRTKTGAYRWTLARGKAVARDKAGRVRRMVGTYIDVTRRKEAEQQIAHMAVHDSLTGLPNRLVFRDRLEREIMRAGRQGGAYALLACDLDGFKAVNDARGHPTGDALLRTVAERLKAIVRDTDTIARLGGDEFAIIMSGYDLPQTASAMAQRMIEAVAEPFDLDGHSASVGVSIGIALGPQDGCDPDQIYKNADVALYRAKAAGRNTFRFYEPGMDAVIAARHGLELDLREAVQRGGFALHYQPIVNAATGAVCGFEALMRWQHPLRGPIPPSEFIPIAEETGLIVALGRWALHEACREAASWPDNIVVAVNISMIQFAQPGLDQTVMMALSASGLPAHRLELEITESVLMEDAEGAVACLHRLRALGVRIALDDFGTGFSSLSYLRRFPFDKIKIDRSFIRDIANPDTAAIVRAIVGIGGRLGAAITAEGVETQDELKQAREEGCTQIQGYLFSKPLPAAEALGFARVGSSKAA